MIKPFTCLTVLLAAGSGLYLYTEKHRTTVLDERIRAVVSETDRIEDRTSMLRAEWALLNQPDRLQTLAAKFLPRLQPMAPTQFVQAADLDKRLPSVGPPPGTVPPATPGMGAPSPTSMPDAAVVMASAAASAAAAKAKPAAPLRVAAAAVHAPVVRVAAHVRRPSELRENDLRTMVAAAWAARVSSPARADAASLVRPGVSYARPAPVYVGAWRPAPVYGTPAAPRSSFAGSALGMAHAGMAPPMAPSSMAPSSLAGR